MTPFSFPYFFTGRRPPRPNTPNPESQDTAYVTPPHRGGLRGGGGGWWYHLVTIPTYLVGRWYQGVPTRCGGGYAV